MSSSASYTFLDIDCGFKPVCSCCTAQMKGPGNPGFTCYKFSSAHRKMRLSFARTTPLYKVARVFVNVAIEMFVFPQNQFVAMKNDYSKWKQALTVWLTCFFCP